MSKNRLQQINPTDIVLMEADANYTIIYLNDGQQLLYGYHLGFLENEFQEQVSFIRPNRKFSVNLKHVVSSDASAVFTQNRRIRISRRRKEIIQHQIENFQLA